jgi:RNA polymerase sigma-70 factor (ECF subfamily)
MYNPDNYRDEDKLIKKSVNKDRKAQHILYNMYAPKMLSVCRYYISDLQYAEDVLLEGFFKVFSKLNSFRSEGSFEGWIRRIMVRECISFLRGQKTLEFSIEEVDVNSSFESLIDSELEVDEIQQLIDALPEGYKIIFNMYAIEGYKHNEIAELLNITEGTSKSQLFKARRMLQQKINELNSTSYGTK